MTQTNRSLHTETQGQCFRGSARTLWQLLLSAALLALLAGCNATVGVGGSTGNTRVGGSVGSTGTVVGIGTSVGPGVAISTYGDALRNGPGDVRANHRQALEALKNGQYDSAATIFEKTLEQHPAHPDATYYLGLTRIYQGQREVGFALLKTYRDPAYYRMTTYVQRSAEYLEKKPELPPKAIHDSMNKERNDGYNRDIREREEMNSWD